MSRARPATRPRTAGTHRSASAPPRRGYQVGHETRQAIIAVAGKVLVESGYAGLTLKRVADAARSGKATKEELSGSTITVTSLGKLGALSGVREFPARVKCASLCWHTLDAALHQQEQVSTE